MLLDKFNGGYMNNIINKVATGVNTIGGQNDKNLKGNVINILNGIIAVLGLVAVAVIIVGGIQYMTSTGDASKVEKAKKTILYGVIGMTICVLSFAIVNFVITNVIANRPGNYTTSKTCTDAGFKWDTKDKQCTEK